MRTEKIIWGLILVFVGGILLLQNFGVIDFYWQVIFRFWPLVLILIGANLLVSNNDSKTGAIISVLLTVFALGFIAYKGITTKESEDSHWSYDFDDNKGEPDFDNPHKNTTFAEPYKLGTQKAVLNISGGATEYFLTDTTDSLFEASVNKHFGKYSLLSTKKDSSQVLDFKMSGKSKWNFKHDNGNRVHLSLNTYPVWDINVKMGAGTTEFDLTPFKIHNLNIEGGAASFEVKLGNPEKVTTVSIETGVSDIDISIPATAACKINSDSGLSSNDFEGFKKQADGSYTTSNFNKTSNVIILNLEGGLSNFQVSRY
ncbi:MAG: hypothetical protein H7Y07_04000 [Pyrinomonadaceae bacterium]|nr:hypothetical protein [Sphingobacteriaceae bacterium]